MLQFKLSENVKEEYFCWCRGERDQAKRKQTTACNVNLDNYKGTLVSKNGSLKMQAPELNVKLIWKEYVMVHVKLCARGCQLGRND